MFDCEISTSPPRDLDEFLPVPGSARQGVFRRLSLAPNGIAALVDMRRRLLQGLSAHPAWAAIETDLRSFLGSLFAIDRLRVDLIDCNSPAALLENLIKCETVHEIGSHRELWRRLQKDRRCYGLFHPALPDEPVAFLELALTRDLSASVQPLIDPESPVADPGSCNFAVFYSVSSCHEGLRGVPFGNTLIRNVIDRLRREWPGIGTFATLSPIPGFRAWVTATGPLDRPGAEIEPALLRLCATYLLRAKRGLEPIDPVARFHLRNGARLERLNWQSDLSAAGAARSFGLTANYVYDPACVDRNREAFAGTGTIIASRRVERLLEV